MYYISEYRATNTLTSAEAETVLWIEGARTVNRDEGAQSDFIRNYNSAQSQMRYGTPVTDAQMNQVSDEITLLVIDDILNNNATSGTSDIPTISDIAANGV